MINIIFPTILIHGIGGNIADLNSLKLSLSERGIDVYNIEIGNGNIDSIFMDMNTQCRLLSQNIKNQNIEGKINLIGISQGGLLARCYVERYSNVVNPVNSLITYGTPHMGIYLNSFSVSFLEYWKNPYKYDEYLENNRFLSFLNNEVNHKDFDMYRNNMCKLNFFVLIWSDKDLIISPKKSAKFEFYNITEAENGKKMPLSIVSLTKSQTYLKDSLCLQTLNKYDKLFIKQYDCLHEDFKKPSCYLNNDYSNNGVNLLNFTISFL